MNTQSNAISPTKNFGKQLAKGSGWMILSRWIIRLIGLVSTIILARVLVPEHFGLVALAMGFYAILDVAGAFGFDMVLIQNQNSTRSHYDTAWTLNVIKSTTLALLMVMLSTQVAQFFQEPRVTPIVQVLALSMFLTGFENIGIVAFRKELQFDKDFKFMVMNKIVAFVTTISLALLWRNYWALIAGIVAGNCMAVLVSYLMHSYRPRFSLSKVGEIFKFSKWLLFNNVIIYLNHQGDDIIVGKLAGPTTLGLYSVAYEISNLPTTELVFPISRAIFPGYSKLQHDIVRFREVFLATLGFIATLTVPMGVGIVLISDLLVPLFLGDNWVGTIPLIQILGIYGVIRVLQSNTGSVYLALGRPYLTAYLIGGQLIVQIPLLIWATSQYGALGTAWALLLSTAVFYPLHFLVLGKLLSISTTDIFMVLWRPFIAVTIMAGSVFFISNAWHVNTMTMSAVKMLTLALTGGVTYTFVILLLWTANGRKKGVEMTVIDEIKRRWA